jgi:hypothetical protein
VLKGEIFRQIAGGDFFYGEQKYSNKFGFRFQIVRSFTTLFRRQISAYPLI